MRRGFKVARCALIPQGGAYFSVRPWSTTTTRSFFFFFFCFFVYARDIFFITIIVSS